MAAHLTPAQARALGITKKTAAKKTKRAVPAKECSPNRCVTCGETFTGETAEARHNKTTGHARFETVLEFDA